MANKEAELVSFLSYSSDRYKVGCIMLLIDGVKYRLWTPKDEEKEFHPMIREHSKELFGEGSIYFDVKHKLISRSGIGSIPDAYVISLSKQFSRNKF